MHIVEGVGCQSSVGHRSIGRLWEYDFFKRYKVRISPCFYKLLHHRRENQLHTYLYNSHMPIRIADNNNLYQRWNMMTGRLKTIIIIKQIKAFYTVIYFHVRRKSSEIRRRIFIIHRRQ